MHLAAGEAPTHTEIGEGVANAAGLPKPISSQTVSAWGKRDKAPDVETNMRALALYLGVSKDWLIEAAGEPLRPDLWAVWLAAREEEQRNAGLTLTVDREIPLPPQTPIPKKVTAKRAGGRGRLRN
jgi:hypothetical protein